MRITAPFLSLAMLCGLSISSLAQVQTNQPSPRVVAQISRTGQTAGIPQRNLFTPQQDGLFRLSVYAVLTSGDNSSNNGVGFSVSYTDDAGTETTGCFFTPGPGAAGCNSGFQGQPPCEWSTVLRANAGTPITWKTYICQGCNVTYEVFATLEKLQPLQ
jgi:hypothetical protein